MAKMHAEEVKYAARLLKTLRQLRVVVGRALHVRAESGVEQQWCGDAADKLERLIANAETHERRDWIHEASRTIERLVETGLQVLPGLTDPRIARKARKRT